MPVHHYPPLEFGWNELFIVMVLAFIVFGHYLPRIMRDLGHHFLFVLVAPEPDRHSRDRKLTATVVGGCLAAIVLVPIIIGALLLFGFTHFTI